MKSDPRTIIDEPVVCRGFDRARRLGVGFYVGYAELTEEGQRFNSAVLIGPDGTLMGKSRKVHLPGSVELRAGERYQQLKKRYFEYGNLGFPAFRVDRWHDAVVGMMICNDRRWPEAWRVLGLQSVELVLAGYNWAAYDPNGGESESAELRTFHSQLVGAGECLHERHVGGCRRQGGQRRWCRADRRLVHRRP
jgi:N-carbamoyl-D-amino-acid hydrolase